MASSKGLENAASGNYKGSQAFTNLTGGDESVNPNTGTLSFSIPLIQLRGIKESINLSTKLLYNAGSIGSFGLPPGWGFDIPFVVPGVSLTTKGRTYVIDPLWKDVSNYSSGLKYINNHGMNFQSISPPLPLPNIKPGEPGYGLEYYYQLRYIDGAKDYFDANGHLLEHADVYGNYQYYQYHEGALLAYIQDSWKQKITFAHQPGTQMVITRPDDSKITINFNSATLDSLLDAVGNTTSFEYIRVGEENPPVISSINYPTNLQSRFEYTSILYLDENYKEHYLPAVQHHYHLDTSVQGGPKLLKHTNYRFGESTGGRTYTGAGANYTMSGLKDSLMESGHTGYIYDVMVLSLDENGEILALKKTEYGCLHLPVAIFNYVIEDGKPREALKTSYEYEVKAGAPLKSTNYDKDVKMELFGNRSKDASNPDYILLARTTTSYSEFGNITSKTEESWDSVNQLRTIRTTTQEWATTKYDIEMEKSNVTRDEVSGSERHMLYTLTVDERAHATKTVAYRKSTDDQLNPWKTYTSLYDENGRFIEETTSWSPGVAIPSGSVASFTWRFAYQFNQGILTESHIDPLGYTTRMEYNAMTFAGPLIRKELPLNQSESRQYDSAGRIISSKNELGEETRFSYSLGDSGNKVVQTNPLQYVEETSYDALGRIIGVSDNGDPTQPYSASVNRQISTKSYDMLSRVKETTNMLGLPTTYNYDALNRPLKEVDSDGNTLEYTYDRAGLQVNKSVNGIFHQIISLDAQGRITSQETHPESTESDYMTIIDHIYDGFGHELQETFSHKLLTGDIPAEVRKKTIKEYDVEGIVSSETSYGYRLDNKDKTDTVRRSYTRDIFGNVYTYIKETTYVDETTFTYNGPIDIYDQNNRLIQHRNQLGQNEQYWYNENNWMVKQEGLGGSIKTISHDACGQALKIETSGSDTSTTYTYLCKNTVSSVRQGTSCKKYEYAIDGTISSVLFGDDRKQTYVLDKFSRSVNEIDVFGVSRATTFDNAGHISSRSCQNDTVVYSYSTTGPRRGRLESVSLTGAISYRRNTTYDGYGRINKEFVISSNRDTLLGNEYKYNSLGQLESSVSTSQKHGGLNKVRKFLYDGIGQVIEDTNITNGETIVTIYSYDGNSNITKVQTGSVTTNMHYNLLNQRTDAGFSYDAQGRLISDGYGRQYEFDQYDRLAEVKSQGNSNSLSYHADGLLAASDRTDTNTKYYYSHTSINAISTTKESIESVRSLFSDSDHIIATYDKAKPATYYFEKQGSTALLLKEDQATILDYKTYGELSATAEVDPHSSFGFCQELLDGSSGLVYLRSRFYDPKTMAFISQDSQHVENRYAYCAGDPINFIDPSGHNRNLRLLALITGTASAMAISFVTAGGATVIAGTSISSTFATTTISAVAGGVGAMGGAFIEATMMSQRLTGRMAMMSFIGGLSAGVTTTLANPAFRAIGVTTPWVQNRFVYGALGGLAQAGAVTALTRRPPPFSQIFMNMMFAGALSYTGYRMWGRIQNTHNTHQLRSSNSQSRSTSASSSRSVSFDKPMANSGKSGANVLPNMGKYPLYFNTLGLGGWHYPDHWRHDSDDNGPTA
ncbi:hypothetical protein TWF730_002659 [Orbilia blumenaviensis]|uniref:Teneurin-like YD-shell domain-containing protein n=1 Tax=Orbilia blumenaviensis TaxID=1796055 RepID=A0AAV9U9R9_9PEZI